MRTASGQVAPMNAVSGSSSMKPNSALPASPACAGTRRSSARKAIAADSAAPSSQAMKARIARSRVVASQAPAKPPSAMPVRKLATITPKAWMLLPTTWPSIRVHSTSCRKVIAPLANISGRTQRPAPAKRAVCGAGDLLAGGGGRRSAAGAGARLAIAAASRKTSPFSAAAAKIVARRPTAGSSQKAASSAPPTAPAVFAAYSRPMRRPISLSRCTAWRASSGSVAPIRVAGMASTTNAHAR